MNNNSKEEEDGGTDIYGYCDHNIEKEKKFFFFFLEAREENIKEQGKGQINNLR